MPKLSLDLRVFDVEGNFVIDPTVFVRLARPDNVSSVTARVQLSGAPFELDIPDGPAGFELALRVSPSRYHEGALFCRVDGDGRVQPFDEIRLPRRSAEWNPAFTPWRLLPEPFGSLQTVLGNSPNFRVGRHSNPERFVEDRYDAVDPADESRILAKLSLLNLHSRLHEEPKPGASKPWFEMVKGLLLATRERFVAEVDEECWSAVRDLEKAPAEGYRKTPIGDHKKNFEAVPGIAQLEDLASVKTREKKANLQLTVARATRNGSPAFLLDADMDENGRLLAHSFDLIKHIFSGGTHPIDIHESLRARFPNVVLGYEVEPRVPVPETRVRLIEPAVA